nr:MAG TPA: hypothetical protein [Caudoviricetes sp.]
MTYVEFSCIINTVIKEYERICGGANIKSFRQWRGGWHIKYRWGYLIKIISKTT